jgi:hypothetical protein
MSVSVKTLMAAAVAFTGAVAFQPAPASAQPYYGPRAIVPQWYYGPAARPAYRPSYRPAYYGARPYYGNRSYYGARRYYGGYPYGYYRRSNNGAVAAGLIGGLALGAIASAAANPYYAPGYYRPTYYEPTTTCFTERRRVVDPYGRLVIRRVQTCY